MSDRTALVQAHVKDELHKKLKIYCALNNLTIRDFVEKAIAEKTSEISIQGDMDGLAITNTERKEIRHSSPTAERPPSSN